MRTFLSNIYMYHSKLSMKKIRIPKKNSFPKIMSATIYIREHFDLKISGITSLYYANIILYLKQTWLYAFKGPPST